MKNYTIPYSTDERLRRVWDLEQVRELITKHVYYQINDWRKEELSDLWVRTYTNMRTASFGKNWGYYVGMDEIYRYYVNLHEERRKEQLDKYCEAHPEVENIPANYGYGSMSMHVINTPVIKIAGDGKTSRSMWYTTGQDTDYTGGDEATAMWYTYRVCADCIFEEGEWRIWHMFVSNDVFFPAGKMYDCPTIIPEGTNPDEIEFGEPTIKILAHDNTFNNADGYPPMPVDYYSFCDELSYGPEGHPKLNKGGIYV